ncbi:hypothetical protein HDU96_004047, partial [Phlyctochytrium bullatum]
SREDSVVPIYPPPNDDEEAKEAELAASARKPAHLPASDYGFTDCNGEERRRELAETVAATKAVHTIVKNRALGDSASDTLSVSGRSTRSLKSNTGAQSASARPTPTIKANPVSSGALALAQGSSQTDTAYATSNPIRYSVSTQEAMLWAMFKRGPEALGRIRKLFGGTPEEAERNFNLAIDEYLKSGANEATVTAKAKEKSAAGSCEDEADSFRDGNGFGDGDDSGSDGEEHAMDVGGSGDLAGGGRAERNPKTTVRAKGAGIPSESAKATAASRRSVAQQSTAAVSSLSSAGRHPDSVGQGKARGTKRKKADVDEDEDEDKGGGGVEQDEEEDIVPSGGTDIQFGSWQPGQVRKEKDRRRIVKSKVKVKDGKTTITKPGNSSDHISVESIFFTLAQPEVLRKDEDGDKMRHILAELDLNNLL